MAWFSKSQQKDDNADVLREDALTIKIATFLWNEDFYSIGKGSSTSENEFRFEARLLARAFMNSIDDEDFTYKLIDIFNESFEPIPPFDFDNSHELAKTIYEIGKK